MSQTGEYIGKKYIQLSSPYKSPQKGFVGRKETLELITASWMGGSDILPLAPLLVGAPGIGKNRLIDELATQTGKELYIFQGHEDVTAEDLACTVRFSDDPDKKMDYVASPLMTAMIKGAICFIDEIAKIRPRALALLVSVLDERRYIDSNLLGERVEAHNGFRFIAATNTADLVGNTLPEFISSRMRPVISVDYQDKTEVDKIISERFSTFETNDIEPLINCFWTKWNELKRENSIFPTPRDAIYIFNLAIGLADFDTSLVAKQHVVVKPEHIEKAFKELFRHSHSER